LNVKITRPVYSESELQKGFEHSDRHHFPLVQIQDRVRRIRCRLRLKDVGTFIVNLLPIVHWLPRYNVRSNFLRDVISGCTIGVMRIPQAMAYAILATLPAVYGLYVAFYPTLVYAVLGTSRHISIGTFAVVSIMTGNAIDGFLANKADTDISTTITPTTAEGTITLPPDNNDQDRVEVAMALCFLVGIIQLLMGILRLGFVTIYLSEPLVRGFTTGAAVHVFTSQFKSLFGIKVPRFSGPLSIVKSYAHFFSHLSETNIATLVISIASIVFLMGASELLDYHANKGFCNREGTTEEEEGESGQPVKKKPRNKLPLPTELVVIVVATAISYKGNFEQRFGVNVVGNIPTGLPTPSLPPFRYFAQLLPDAVAIAIVAFAISVSMASLMAKRNNYEVNSNQELLAYGSCSIVSSFFHCFPHAASLSRSVVQESSGGKTQVAGFVSSVLVLVVLLFLGVLFTQLPVACLASVIVVALRGMFRQFKDILVLWKVSMIDLSIWIVSFVAVVFIGVDIGLMTAVLYSLITVIVRTQKPYCVLVGKIPGTDIYRDIAVMKDAEELPGIKIFRASSPLCFVNVEHFKASLYSKVGIDPQKELTKEGNGQTCCSCSCLNGKASDEAGDDEEELSDEEGSQSTPTPTDVRDVHTIIIDCSMFSFIDVVGIKMLQNIVADYKELGIRVVFANCKAPIRRSMLMSSKLRKDHTIDLGHMYVSIHDAVLHFSTPSNSPEMPKREQLVTKSSRSASMYDFDPASIAASNLSLHSSSIAASLEEHIAARRSSASTTTLSDVKEENQKPPVELHDSQQDSHHGDNHLGNNHVDSKHTNSQPKNGHDSQQDGHHGSNHHGNNHVDNKHTNGQPKNGQSKTGQAHTSDGHQNNGGTRYKPCVNLAYEPEHQIAIGTPMEDTKL
ncbi:prestin-like, partial [Amphiura filiformis]|uniref:prestin-like n=1 Tax=Amphiura filiformis TaxID=82378 RepID=UPI003B214782